MSRKYNNRFRIKATTVGELCMIYAVTYKTLKKWLLPHQEKIGKRQGNFYSAKQVETIFEVLGLPKVIEDE
jgi:phage antirepressor YoqD-like protein